MRTTTVSLLAWGLSIVLGTSGAPAPAIDRDRISLVATGDGYAIVDARAGAGTPVPVPRAWLVPPDEEKQSADEYLSAFNYGTRTNAFEIGDGRLGVHCASYEIMESGTAGYAAGRDKILLYDPRSRRLTAGGLVPGVTKRRLRHGECPWPAEHTRLFVGDADGDGLTDVGIQREGLPCPEAASERDASRTGKLDGPKRYRLGPIEWHVVRGDVWQRAESRDGTTAPVMAELPLIDLVQSPVTFALRILRDMAPGAQTPPGPSLTPYRGAREFCAGHVTGAPGATGPGPHILWTAYATSDPPANVVAYYQRDLARENYRHEGRRHVWRLPPAEPERVLTVSAVADALIDGQCQAPPAGAATLIVISTMIRSR